MKILCVSYRKWALEIYARIQNNSEHTYIIIDSRNKYSDNIVNDFNPDYILFYGWSWLVSNEIINKYKCIMLHPSPLPKFRGGSPIQNQIIKGKKESMVTLFFMTEDLDAGDIILQKSISLKGHLNDIFKEIIEVGVNLTLKFIKGDYTIIKQNNNEATYCKRRKPSDSEITMEELQIKPAEYIFNKIRMLEDPYPNAFIKTVDGKKILLKLVEVENENN